MFSNRIQQPILITIFLLTTPPLNAEVTETLNYAYYKASADPSRSLLSILDAATPIQTNGKPFHGKAYWHIKWNFRWNEQSNGRCKILSVTTKLTCDIQLPKLLGATGEQKNQLNKYLSALRTHELGHCKIGKKAAKTIDRKILYLPEMSSCKDLGSAGNEIGYRTLEDYGKKDDQYDEKTKHGETQGARLDR